MVQDNMRQTGVKRRKLEILKKLINDHECNILRLIDELNDGNYKDDYTRNVFRQKINENSIAVKELEKELKELEVELAQIEVTEGFQQEIKAMAAQIQGKLSNATFDGKRALLDKLDIKVVFQVEGKSKWLDVSCSLISAPESVELHHS